MFERRRNSALHQQPKILRNMDILATLKPSCTILKLFFSSLKSDADDEFLSVQNHTLHVNYSHSDYLLSYTATFPPQGPSAIMKEVIYDPIQSYPMIRYLHWHLSQKKTNL